MSDLIVVDIETSSPDPTKPDLSLDTHRNIIELIGYTEGTGENAIKVYRPNTQLTVPFLANCPLGGHNLKFDFRTLVHHGAKLSIDQFAHDSLIMAVASIRKVPDSYIEQYEAKRRELSKDLPRGQKYREGSKHSLKVVAPYFLGVSPFWENPATTIDEEYLKLDVKYTAALIAFFSDELRKQGVWQFYEEKLLPWTRMTLQAELDGITIDMQALQELKAKAEAGVTSSLSKLREAWHHVEAEWERKCKTEIGEQYSLMREKAVQKLKPDDKKLEEKKAKAITRYAELEQKALQKVEPFNYASPSQLLWAFKEVLDYPTTNLEGDETTGASVLELLAAQGKEDIKLLLEYKENYKLAHAYFPSYEALVVDNKIHASFKIHGTRTGRLSCSDPNLQQIPPVLKKIFVPAKGNAFVSLDLSAIEPVLIAYYTEDETLCRILIDGLDFHGFAAVALFPEAGLLPKSTRPEEVKKLYPAIRQAAKQVDLSLFYGSGKNRLFTTLTMHGMPVPEKTCQKMVYAFRDMFKDVFFFKEMLDAELHQGGDVENLFGRRYSIPDKEDIYMKGFNTLIQGSASDLLLQGTLDCLKEMESKNIPAALRLLVHDNTVLECREQDAQYVYDRLAYHLTKFKLHTKHGLVPLKVEGVHGKTWKC